MSNYIPKIGLRGLYTLLPPFDTQLIPNIAYGCIAVRRLSDIVAAGGDPFVDYYEPMELTDVEYKADIANGVCIVSLQANDDNIVYVPSSYIQGFPNIGGVPYTSMMLGIKLGAIPDKLDLTYLKTRIAAVVLETIGITAETKASAISHPTLLDQEDADVLEAARLAATTIVKTDRALYLESEALLASARAKILELETFIRDNPPA